MTESTTDVPAEGSRFVASYSESLFRIILILLLPAALS